MPQVSLKNYIDDWKDFLGMEPEELGVLLLLAMKSGGARYFSRVQIPEAIAEYEVQRQPGNRALVERVFVEAWVWLEREGFLVPALGQIDQWILSRRAESFTGVEDLETYRKAKLLPRDKLHSTIANNVYSAFIRGAYSTAVFEAFREVEVAVRDAGDYSNAEIGVPLMRKAFAVPNGPLTDPGLERAEQEATNALFAGAIGRYKNPHSHRNEVLDDPVEAVEILLFASHLLRIVDAASERRAETQE